MLSGVAPGARPATAGPGASFTIPGALDGVAATSSANAWAVGYTGTFAKTLILRWNGATWKRVPSPSPGRNNQLLGVTAASASSAWAVGYTGTLTRSKTLILRWNGATWKRVPSPSPVYGELQGVAVIANRAWAVGFSSVGTVLKTLILGWNGKTWRRVRSPDGGGGYAAGLSAVAGLSGSDAWAVGASSPSGTGCACAPLVVRWNGTTWAQVPSPIPGGVPLAGVAAASARNAWAVGWTMAGQTVILQWNGTVWKRVPSPSPAAESLLNGVTAISARNAWAVGCNCSTSRTTLILHWNGKNWN